MVDFSDSNSITVENNDNKVRNNRPDMAENIGPRDKTVKFKLEETFITEERKINPTDNKEIRSRKNKSSVDAVKQQN